MRGNKAEQPHMNQFYDTQSAPSQKEEVPENVREWYQQNITKTIEIQPNGGPNMRISR